MKRDLFANVRGKCSKTNPTTCRLHGRKVKERIEFERQVREQAKQLAFKEKADKDFEASWKLRREKDGTTTVSVYRSGVPTPPETRGVEAESYEACDQYLPQGRQGRYTGVFASPTLGGVARWVRGNAGYSKILDYKPRELRVDIDNTWVYSVRDWEIASSKNTESAYRDYWANGMTMREYMERACKEPHNYDPTEWELLIPVEGIRSVKPVSANRVAEVAYDSASSVLSVLKNHPRLPAYK